VQSKKLNGTYQNYANAFTYTSAGAVSSMRLGNGKFENTTFNSRLQPIQIGLGSSATSQNLLKLNFDYGVADNNGNVKSQQITVQQGNQTPLVLNQSYMYDSLNRLKSAEEKDVNNAQVWKQTYVFDRYGNRNFDAANNNTTNLVGTLPKVTNPEILPSNNRLKADQDGDNVVDYLYDASGNLTKDVDNKRFGYDAENKQVQYFASNNQTTTPNGTYFFDGDGKRVKKISPTETTIYVYDAGGKLVAEYSTQQADTPKINYTTNDHLGSPRITTDQNGQVISRSDYMPYGEEILSTQRISDLGYTVQDSVKQGFTGYERDSETNLDYAEARMYASKLGRFMNPDPLLSSGKIENPLTWNRYGYVLGNPLKNSDPLGLFTWAEDIGGNKTDKELKGTSAYTISKKEQTRVDGIISQRDKIRTALKALETAAASTTNGLTTSQKAEITATRAAFGDEHKDNQVEVNTAPLVAKGLAQAGTFNFSNKSYVFFDSNETSPNALALSAANEGSNVANFKNFLKDGKNDMTQYKDETQSYRVESYVAQGLGLSSDPISGSTPDLQIWNKGWATSEREKLRSEGIDRRTEKLYKSKTDGKPLTRANQGPTFTEMLKNQKSGN
jgi:RHS repeat-associated protein